MKKYLLLFFIISNLVFTQFKEELNKPVNIRNGIVSNNTSSFLLGFLNSPDFRMNHSFSLSYSAFGNNGIALGVYTNSMAYKFSDKLNVEVDASIINSPYSSFGNNFTDQINGIYLSRAEINYKPTSNLFLSIQFRNAPYGYYSRDYFGFSPFYRPSLFEE